LAKGQNLRMTQTEQCYSIYEQIFKRSLAVG